MDSSESLNVSFTEDDYQENGIVQKSVPYTFIGAMEKSNFELSSMCISFMKKHLTRVNCFQRLNLATEYDCEELIQAVNRYIFVHLDVLTSHPDFLELTPNQVNRFIKLENRRVNAEAARIDDNTINPALLPGIIRWVKHAPLQREKHLFKLIKNLKLEAVDAVVLRRIFWEDGFIRNNLECRNLYLEIIHNKYFFKNSYPAEDLIRLAHTTVSGKILQNESKIVDPSSSGKVLKVLGIPTMVKVPKGNKSENDTFTLELTLPV